MAIFDNMLLSLMALCNKTDKHRLSDFELCKYWMLEGKTPGARNREWITEIPTGSFGDLAAARSALDTFDFSVEPNTDTVITANIAAINDTANTPRVLDIGIRSGFLCVTEPFTMRWRTNSEGAIFFKLGQCGGPLKEVMAYAKGVGLLPTPEVYIPAGIHRYELINVDTGGSNSNWTPQTTSDFVTWVNNNQVFDSLSSQTNVVQKGIKAKVFKSDGSMVDALSGVALDPTALMHCEIPCEPAEPEPMFVRENTTPRVMNFVNEGDIMSLTDANGDPFPAGTLGTINSIEDIGTGFVRWSIDGSTPATGTGNSFVSNGPYHAGYNLRNVDLSLVRLDGSSANSDYSVAFEVYN